MIISSKDQPLTTEFVLSSKCDFKIDNFEELAKVGIHVLNGFDCVIINLEYNKEVLVKSDTELFYVFEDDIHW